MNNKNEPREYDAIDEIMIELKELEPKPGTIEHCEWQRLADRIIANPLSWQPDSTWMFQ